MILDTEIVDDLYTVTKKCTFCDYQYTDKFFYDSVVDTNSEWNLLFDTFKLTNYTMNVYLDDGSYNSCMIDENGVKVLYDSILDFYSIKQDDGSFITYEYYNGENKWYVSDDTSDEEYQRMLDESVLHFQFLDAFDKFTYDLSTGVCKCESELIAIVAPDEDLKEELKLYNTEIIIINGKIYSIKADYKLSSDNTYEYKFEYFDIYSTVVTVPDDIKNNAIKE